MTPTGANKRITRGLLLLTGAGWAVAAMVCAAPSAHADIPPNCEVHGWGFLGLTKKRIICDEPIQANGSWMRERWIGVPAHNQNASSSCSGGMYYSNCTFYPGGWVEAQADSDDTYPVTSDTVLPDEPGHMP